MFKFVSAPSSPVKLSPSLEQERGGASSLSKMFTGLQQSFSKFRESVGKHAFFWVKDGECERHRAGGVIDHSFGFPRNETVRVKNLTGTWTYYTDKEWSIVSRLKARVFDKVSSQTYFASDTCVSPVDLNETVFFNPSDPFTLKFYRSISSDLLKPLFLWQSLEVEGVVCEQNKGSFCKDWYRVSKATLPLCFQELVFKRGALCFDDFVYFSDLESLKDAISKQKDPLSQSDKQLFSAFLSGLTAVSKHQEFWTDLGKYARYLMFGDLIGVGSLERQAFRYSEQQTWAGLFTQWGLDASSVLLRGYSYAYAPTLPLQLLLMRVFGSSFQQGIQFLFPKQSKVAPIAARLMTHVAMAAVSGVDLHSVEWKRVLSLTQLTMALSMVPGLLTESYRILLAQSWMNALSFLGGSLSSGMGSDAAHLLMTNILNTACVTLGVSSERAQELSPHFSPHVISSTKEMGQRLSDAVIYFSEPLARVGCELGLSFSDRCADISFPNGASGRLSLRVQADQLIATQTLLSSEGKPVQLEHVFNVSNTTLTGASTSLRGTSGLFETHERTSFGDPFSRRLQVGTQNVTVFEGDAYFDAVALPSAPIGSDIFAVSEDPQVIDAYVSAEYPTAKQCFSVPFTLTTLQVFNNDTVLLSGTSQFSLINTSSGVFSTPVSSFTVGNQTYSLSTVTASARLSDGRFVMGSRNALFLFSSQGFPLSVLDFSSTATVDINGITVHPFNQSLLAVSDTKSRLSLVSTDPFVLLSRKFFLEGIRGNTFLGPYVAVAGITNTYFVKVDDLGNVYRISQSTLRLSASEESVYGISGSGIFRFTLDSSSSSNPVKIASENVLDTTLSGTLLAVLYSDGAVYAVSPGIGLFSFDPETLAIRNIIPFVTTTGFSSLASDGRSVRFWGNSSASTGATLCRLEGTRVLPDGRQSRVYIRTKPLSQGLYHTRLNLNGVNTSFAVFSDGMPFLNFTDLSGDVSFSSAGQPAFQGLPLKPLVVRVPRTAFRDDQALNVSGFSFSGPLTGMKASLDGDSIVFSCDEVPPSARDTTLSQVIRYTDIYGAEFVKAIPVSVPHYPPTLKPGVLLPNASYPLTVSVGANPEAGTGFLPLGALFEGVDVRFVVLDTPSVLSDTGVRTDLVTADDSGNLLVRALKDFFGLQRVRIQPVDDTGKRGDVFEYCIFVKPSSLSLNAAGVNSLIQTLPVPISGMRNAFYCSVSDLVSSVDGYPVFYNMSVSIFNSAGRRLSDYVVSDSGFQRQALNTSCAVQPLLTRSGLSATVLEAQVLDFCEGNTAELHILAYAKATDGRVVRFPAQDVSGRIVTAPDGSIVFNALELAISPISGNPIVYQPPSIVGAVPPFLSAKTSQRVSFSLPAVSGFSVPGLEESRFSLSFIDGTELSSSEWGIDSGRVWVKLGPEHLSENDASRSINMVFRVYGSHHSVDTSISRIGLTYNLDNSIQIRAVAPSILNEDSSTPVLFRVLNGTDRIRVSLTANQGSFGVSESVTLEGDLETVNSQLSALTFYLKRNAMGFCGYSYSVVPISTPALGQGYSGAVSSVIQGSFDRPVPIATVLSPRSVTNSHQAVVPILVRDVFSSPDGSLLNLSNVSANAWVNGQAGQVLPVSVTLVSADNQEYELTVSSPEMLPPLVRVFMGAYDPVSGFYSDTLVSMDITNTVIEPPLSPSLLTRVQDYLPAALGASTATNVFFRFAFGVTVRHFLDKKERRKVQLLLKNFAVWAPQAVAINPDGFLQFQRVLFGAAQNPMVSFTVNSNVFKFSQGLQLFMGSMMHFLFKHSSDDSLQKLRSSDDPLAHATSLLSVMPPRDVLELFFNILFSRTELKRKYGSIDAHKKAYYMGLFIRNLFLLIPLFQSISPQHYPKDVFRSFFNKWFLSAEQYLAFHKADIKQSIYLIQLMHLLEEMQFLMSESCTQSFDTLCLKLGHAIWGAVTTALPFYFVKDLLNSAPMAASKAIVLYYEMILNPNRFFQDQTLLLNLMKTVSKSGLLFSKDLPGRVIRNTYFNLLGYIMLHSCQDSGRAYPVGTINSQAFLNLSYSGVTSYQSQTLYGLSSFFKLSDRTGETYGPSFHKASCFCCFGKDSRRDLSKEVLARFSQLFTFLPGVFTDTSSNNGIVYREWRELFKTLFVFPVISSSSVIGSASSEAKEGSTVSVFPVELAPFPTSSTVLSSLVFAPQLLIRYSSFYYLSTPQEQTLGGRGAGSGQVFSVANPLGKLSLTSSSGSSKPIRLPAAPSGEVRGSGSALKIFSRRSARAKQLGVFVTAQSSPPDSDSK